MKRFLGVVYVLAAATFLAMAGCGQSKPKAPDPNYVDPAANPSAMPATPVNPESPPPK